MITIEIHGPPQSGKTKCATGIVGRFSTEGIRCLVVDRTFDGARDRKRRLNFPCCDCVWADYFLRLPAADLNHPWRVIVLEDLDSLPSDTAYQMIEHARTLLRPLDGPSQLVLINPPPLKDFE